MQHCEFWTYCWLLLQFLIQLLFIVFGCCFEFTTFAVKSVFKVFCITSKNFQVHLNIRWKGNTPLEGLSVFKELCQHGVFEDSDQNVKKLCEKNIVQGLEFLLCCSLLLKSIARYNCAVWKQLVHTAIVTHSVIFFII